MSRYDQIVAHVKEQIKSGFKQYDALVALPIEKIAVTKQKEIINTQPWMNFSNVNNATVLLPIVDPNMYKAYKIEIGHLVVNDDGEDRIKKCKVTHPNAGAGLKAALKINTNLKFDNIRPLTKAYVSIYKSDIIAKALACGLKDSIALGLYLMCGGRENWVKVVNNLPESEDINIATLSDLRV